jgi:hypothetical protein
MMVEIELLVTVYRFISRFFFRLLFYSPTRFKRNEKKKKKKADTTYLPKLFRGIFPSKALQDLCATGVFVDEVGHVIHALVDDHIQALFGSVVTADVGWSEGFFGHFSFLFPSLLPLRTLVLNLYVSS